MNVIMCHMHYAGVDEYGTPLMCDCFVQVQHIPELQLSWSWISVMLDPCTLLNPGWGSVLWRCHVITVFTRICGLLCASVEMVQLQSLYMKEVGMYRIWIFQIRPQPDLAGFTNWNLAGAGFRLEKNYRTYITFHCFFSNGRGYNIRLIN